MSNVRRLALMTAFAAALGGVIGVVSIVLNDPAEVTAPPDDAVDRSPVAGGDAGTGTPTSPDQDAVTAERVLSLTQRLDSRDADERHELALDLLRRGPAALPQARALRPESTNGRDLQARLIAALQKMRALRRGGDYARLEEHLRLRLDLDAFATVIPDEHLREERRAYWSRALDAVRERASRGLATDGEVALAELELARARRDLGEIESATYDELADDRLPEFLGWIASLRARRDVSPARIEALEEQAGRLAP